MSHLRAEFSLTSGWPELMVTCRLKSVFSKNQISAPWEFFKVKWSQDKGLILPKEPKDLFRLSFSPVLKIDLFLRVILAVIIKQCSLWTLGLENFTGRKLFNVKDKDTPLHFIQIDPLRFLDIEKSKSTVIKNIRRQMSSS